MAKPKPTKAPAKRKFAKLRALFAEPGVALTLDEVAKALGTLRHSAGAAISVLGNPAKTDDSLRISLDRETGKYSVQPTNVAGASAKKISKKKVGRKGSANGPRQAAA